MNFKGKKGPGYSIVKREHRQSGAKEGGQRAAKVRKLFDKVKAAPLNWGSNG